MKLSTQKGFTLIEILAAVLVTVIALLGLLAISAQNGQANLTSRHRAVATSLGEEVMEDLRGQTMDQINTLVGGPPPQAFTLPATSIGDSFGQSYERQIITSPTVFGNLFLVRVVISWTDGRTGNIKQVAMEMIRNATDGL